MNDAVDIEMVSAMTLNMLNQMILNFPDELLSQIATMISDEQASRRTTVRD